VLYLHKLWDKAYAQMLNNKKDPAKLEKL
jgi:hypothetical protein